jgi:PAS domain S-box-containing protein
LTILARRAYRIEIVYSHLFYVPIVLAAYWFGTRGIFAGILLATLVVLSPVFEGELKVTSADAARALTMLFVSLVSITMADTIKQQTVRLKLSENLYKAVFENSGTAIILADKDTTISLVNQNFEKLTGLSKGQVEGKMSWKEFFLETDLELLLEYYHMRESKETQTPLVKELKFVTGDDVLKDIVLSMEHINGSQKTVLSIQDITAIKALKEEKEKLSERLEKALEKVLSGFIPICANCKRIRDESGNWIQPEVYISKRSEAQFSHGICPECKERLYGSFLKGQPGVVKENT